MIVPFRLQNSKLKVCLLFKRLNKEITIVVVMLPLLVKANYIFTASTDSISGIAFFTAVSTPFFKVIIL